MNTVEMYQKGYDDMKKELEESLRFKISKFSNGFINDMIAFPSKMFSDIMRNRDEERGRHDALHGLDFNPYRKS